MWMYFVVFLGSLAVDTVPFITPPAWTVMVFLLVKFDLNPWAVLLAGVPGSALGRYILSLYIPKVSNRFIKRHKNEELEFVGKKLGQNLWRSWLFVFLYTLTPLSSTALFTAAGMARIKALQIVPPFFVSKFIIDAVMIFSGRFIVRDVADLLHGALDWKTISTAVLGLLLIGALLFVNWRVLLEQKKVKLTFNIWK
jgi:membrane protein YqaA with SNARE-associated domain